MACTWRAHGVRLVVREEDNFAVPPQRLAHLQLHGRQLGEGSSMEVLHQQGPPLCASPPPSLAAASAASTAASTAASASAAAAAVAAACTAVGILDGYRACAERVE